MAGPYFPTPNSTPNSSAVATVTTLVPAEIPRETIARSPTSRATSTRRLAYE